MLIALDPSNKPIRASKGAEGVCPGCRSILIPKCGEINVHHWAHKVGDCDPWYEPETEWHRNWKMLFGDDNVEKVITKNGVVHRADVLMNDTVVEFQNTHLSLDELKARESFYGNMVWIINCTNKRVEVKRSRTRWSSKLDTTFAGLTQYKKLRETVSSRLRKMYTVDDYKNVTYKANWFTPWRTFRYAEKPVILDLGAASPDPRRPLLLLVDRGNNLFKGAECILLSISEFMSRIRSGAPLVSYPDDTSAYMSVIEEMRRYFKHEYDSFHYRMKIRKEREEEACKEKAEAALNLEQYTKDVLFEDRSFGAFLRGAQPLFAVGTAGNREYSNYIRWEIGKDLKSKMSKYYGRPVSPDIVLQIKKDALDHYRRHLGEGEVIKVTINSTGTICVSIIKRDIR